MEVSEEELDLFYYTNDFMYINDIQGNTGATTLSNDELQIFNQRYKDFTTEYGFLSGFWGIFALGFTNKSGSMLLKHFYEQNIQDYYHRISYNSMILNTHKINIEIGKDLIRKILDKEILTNKKLLQSLKEYKTEINGIKNVSKTCYVSVAMQILLRFKPFVESLKNNYQPHTLSSCLLQIYSSLISENQVTHVSLLLEFLKIDPFKSDDPFNFLNYFFRILREVHPHLDYKLFISSTEIIFPIQLLQNTQECLNILYNNVRCEVQPKMLIIQLLEYENVDKDTILNLFSDSKFSNDYHILGSILYQGNGLNGHYTLITYVNENIIYYDDNVVFSFDKESRNYSSLPPIIGIILLKNKEDFLISSQGKVLLNDLLKDDFPRFYSISNISNYLNKLLNENDEIENKDDSKIMRFVQIINESESSFFVKGIKLNDIHTLIDMILSKCADKSPILIGINTNQIKNYIMFLAKYKGILIFDEPSEISLSVSKIIFTNIGLLNKFLDIELPNKLLLIIIEGFACKKEEFIQINSILKKAVEINAQLISINHVTDDPSITEFDLGCDPIEEEEDIHECDSHQAEIVNESGIDSTLMFDSLLEAKEKIKYAGWKAGAELSIRSSEENRIRFYCHLKNKELQCGFTLTVRKKKKTNKFHIISMTKHNHSLDPRDTIHYLMNTEQLSRLMSLRKAQTGINSIIKLMKKWYKIELIYRQIRHIEYHYKQKDMDLMQSKSLINYIEKINGDHHEYKVDINGITCTKGVLTFTKKELSNLNSTYVLAMDGTHFPNFLGWELVPLVSKNCENHIVCCGVLFATILNKEIVIWLLQCIFSHNESRNIRTIFSDEDLSLVFGIPDFNTMRTTDGETKINHGLCRRHKTENFKKHVKKHVKNEQDADNMIKYFQIMLETPHDDIAEQNLNLIEAFNYAEINSYLRDCVLPHGSKLMASKMNCLCLGIYTTNISESSNSLVKSTISHSYDTLVSMRKRIIFHFDKKEREENVRIKNRNQIALDIKIEFPQLSGPKYIMSLLDASLKKAKRLQVEIKGDSCYYFDDESENCHHTLFDKANKICSCRRLHRDGLFCSHFLKYMLDNNLEIEWSQIHPFYQLKHDNNDAIINEDISIPELNEDCQNATINPEEPAQNGKLTKESELWFMMRQLFNFCKDNPDLYDQTKDFMLNKITVHEENVVEKCKSTKHADNEVDFVQKVSARGRPKKNRFISPDEDGTWGEKEGKSKRKKKKG